jgi:hypothetical protein
LQYLVPNGIVVQLAVPGNMISNDHCYPPTGNFLEQKRGQILATTASLQFSKLGQTETDILLLSSLPFYICPTFEIRLDIGGDTTAQRWLNTSGRTKFTEIARAKLTFKDFTYQMLLLNLIITIITAASSE